MLSIMKERLSQFLPTRAGLMTGGSLLFLLGGGIGFVISDQQDFSAQFTPVLDANTGYQFIRPLLSIQTTAAYGESKLGKLRPIIEDVAKEESDGKVIRYSYYLRDLTNSAWLGINENDQYDPASMLKVVVALAVYKQNDATPGFVNQYLTYTQELADINAAFPFAPPVVLKVGRSYPIKYLLEEMLSNSDNAAKDLLLSAIDQPVLNKIYDDLSIRRPGDENSAGYTISPVEYSRFLRVLYFGTYDITWKNDDLLLKLLNDSTFTEGLVSGVPSNIHVAHKFGEHVLGSNGVVSGVELSDCGIIYHPTHPYLLCVMTEGKDELQLSHFIAQLSRATYDFINKQ